MDDRRFRLFVGGSLGLHLAVLAAMLLGLPKRDLPEPTEQAIAVELIAPSEMAQGEQLAPRPAPNPVPAP
ncbi:MAG TPA: hypothetical protein VEY31_13175, partial [Roseococcus sp.]|nr:hypothetical protein [Roseococcus sp.]